ncbi:hypothetical protein BBJ28_00026362 [Nothophytophthora sp. Chile5]|nr:hypothetical protein BBJ28_00026362 [Nothophytophthora sp. Chile5]
MATSLLDLAVPGFGSALALFGQLYTKYSQLKEGKELCTSLHKRLEDFLEQLRTTSPDTLQAEALLLRLRDLIKEYSAAVGSYADEPNFVKRVMKLGKFMDEVKVYNERLDSLIAMISVKQMVNLIEWRSQFEKDTVDMMSKLTDLHELQKEIWRAIRQLPTKKDVVDMALVMKRDVSDDVNPESTPQPLDRVMRSIVNTAETKFLDGKKLAKPPTWLIAADEVTIHEPAIDRDGTTVIYEGEWQGVRVAVKEHHVVIDENPVFDKHFAVWRSLQHPHVAQLYGAGSRDGAPFFVYEFASHKSLDRCWKKLELTQKELWQMLHQAALGLSYLHRKQVVHGNLSCSKLLVNHQGIVKLFGFGASYVRENNRSNSIRPETREEFAAPECIGIGPDGRDCGVRHSPSFKSDVYSFGLMIVEAIAKEGPLETMRREDIRERKRSDLLVRPEAMTAEACNLVQRMCVCDPAQRVSLAFVTEQLGQLAQ